MKYLITLVGILMLVGTVSAQRSADFGTVFNQPTQFYQKTNPTTSTANDTSSWLSLKGGQAALAVFGAADDSAAVLLFYRLRSSSVGAYRVTGSFTAIDTLGPAGDGSMATTSGAAQLLGTIAVATLTGYDEIQFHTDYLTGTSNGAADGTSNIVRFHYYLLKPSQVR